MQNDDLFKEMLKDPIFSEKYGLSKNDLAKIHLQSKADEDVISILQIIISEVYKETPQKNLYKQIKHQLKIK